ncbi:unnamed protein product, partial [Allacma fusca]
ATAVSNANNLIAGAVDQGISDVVSALLQGARNLQSVLT